MYVCVFQCESRCVYNYICMCVCVCLCFSVCVCMYLYLYYFICFIVCVNCCGYILLVALQVYFDVFSFNCSLYIYLYIFSYIYMFMSVCICVLFCVKGLVFFFLLSTINGCTIILCVCVYSIMFILLFVKYSII